MRYASVDEIKAARRQEAEGRTQEAPAAIILPVPNGFAYEAELIEIADLVIAQLKTGMSKRECLRRLHGWMPGEGA